MKLLPTGVGAEPKKLAALGILLVALAAVYWFQYRSDGPTVSASVAPPQSIPAVKPLPAASAPVTASPTPAAPRRSPGGGGNPSIEDFRPTLKVKDDLDVSKIDPRIRLDLLAKVRAVSMEGGTSSLFEYSKAPEPPAPKVDAIKPTAVVPVPPPAPAAPKGPTAPPAPPPPPPIPFKYYGFAGKAADGQLQGFFREGDGATEEIFIARENELLRNRYKIIRVGIKSAVVEDTTNHSQKTLEMLEEAQ